jgi:lipopolysaccharide export system permease protein
VRILTRYVLFDLLRVFLLALTGMTMVIFIVLAGNEFVDKGLGLGPLLRMTPYLLPQAMQFAVPGTMLLATTSVYGRLSGYHEIVAIKSMGISPMALVWPTLILATVVSFGAVLLNDIAVSWGRLGVQRVFIESIEEIVYGQLRMQRTYSTGNLSITVPRVEGRTLVQPTLVVKATAGRPPLTVSAEQAEIESDPVEGVLKVRFYDFEVDGPVTIKNPDMYEYVMSLDELVGGNSKYRSPSTFALGEIPQAKREQRERIETLHREMTTHSAFSLLTGRFEALAEQTWNIHKKDLTGAQYRLHRFNTEPYRRWSNGFSCLCFVLVGAAMSMRMRQSDFLAIFFVCFLPILIVYYPLLMISLDKAKGGALPPQAVWLGNIVLVLWGAWLMRRVIRF